MALTRDPPQRLAVTVTVGLLAVITGALISVHPAFAVLALAAWIPIVITRHVRYMAYILAASLGVNVTVFSDPVHLSLPQVAGVLLVIAVGVRVAVRLLPTHRGGAWWPWSGFLFAAAALPAVVTAVFVQEALIGVAQLVLVASVIYAATRLLTAYPGAVEPTLRVVAIAAMVSVLPALVQSGFSVGPESFIRSGMMRAYSTYGQPNSYGHYLAAMVPLFLGLATDNKRFILPLTLTTIALLLTLSRGAIAATALGTGFFLLAHQLRSGSRGLGSLVAIASVLGLAAMLLVPSQVVTKLVDFGDWSVQQRGLALLSSWTAILDRPFLGYGPGAFKMLRPGIALSGLVDDVEMPHNFPIEIWLELGFLALACFLTLVVLYYAVTLRGYWRSRDVTLAALAAGFTGLLAASLTGSLLIRGVEETFALIVALTAARLAAIRNASPANAHSIPV